MSNPKSEMQIDRPDMENLKERFCGVSFKDHQNIEAQVVETTPYKINLYKPNQRTKPHEAAQFISKSQTRTFAVWTSDWSKQDVVSQLRR